MRKRDAIRSLQEQHLLVRVLLSNLEMQPLGAEEARRELLERVSSEAALHSKIESDVVLPALRELLQRVGEEHLYLEILERHHLVDFDFLVAQLRRLGPSSTEFQAATSRLRRLVDGHTRTEDALLSRARALCDDERMHALGMQMEDLRWPVASAVDESPFRRKMASRSVATLACGVVWLGSIWSSCG